MRLNASQDQHENARQQQLVSILQLELDHVKRLMLSLEAEYTALAEPHSTTLEEIVHSKQETIHELEQIGQQREALLGSINASAIEDSSNIGNPFMANRQLSILWQELVSLAEQCQQKNRINGSIVELASRQSRHALDILHGISPKLSSRPELYDQSGNKTQSAITHSLTKA